MKIDHVILLLLAIIFLMTCVVLAIGLNMMRTLQEMGASSGESPIATSFDEPLETIEYEIFEESEE